MRPRSLSAPPCAIVGRSAGNPEANITLGFLITLLAIELILGEHSLHGADFFCRSGDVTCLIASINNANRNGEEDTIDLEPGIYTLTMRDNMLPGEGANGLPIITTAITIRQSDLSATIERDPNAEPFRIFDVSPTGRLSLFGLGLRYGVMDTGSAGGAILNRGTVNIDKLAIYSISSGAAIYNVGGDITVNSSNICCNSTKGLETNGGHVSLIDSFIFANNAGGLSAIDSIVEINRTTIFENESEFAGAGISAIGRQLTITNSTIARNVARGGAVGGGVLWRSGQDLRILNSTIAGNQASHGGGIYVYDAGTIENSILAQNTAAPDSPDCGSANPSHERLVSTGHNIFGDPPTPCVDLQPTDIVGDPRLAEWRFGYFPLLPGSPAIDGGNTSVCLSNPLLATDQIGELRAGICDIGAIEFQPPTTVLTVAVNVKPGSHDNSINPRSKGVVPVAILSSSGFDATTVDIASLRFGPGQAVATHTKPKTKDVNHDHQRDLFLQFRTQDTGIQCGDTSVSITGETVGGTPFQGSDTIRTVGCKQKH